MTEAPEDFALRFMQRLETQLKEARDETRDLRHRLMALEHAVAERRFDHAETQDRLDTLTARLDGAQQRATSA